MSGMNPRISCTQCGSVLTLADSKCPSCGVKIDWTNGKTSVQGTSSHHIKTHNNRTVAKWSSKSVIGILVAVVIIVIGYEVLTTKKQTAEPIQQTTNQPLSSTMQMPSHVQELINRVESNPNDMTSTLELANILHDNQIYDKAVHYYQKYLGSKPNDTNARVDLGICYKELGNFIEAKKEMKEALKTDPKHLFAHFNLGVVYLSEGSIKESNEWFKKTVDLSPTSEVGKRAQQLLSQHKSQKQNTNK